MVVLTVIFIIYLFGVHKGAEEYNRVLSEVKEFQESENTSFKLIRNYVEYSKNGFKVNFVPSPNMVLFTNPSIMTEIFARLNSVIILNIYNDSKKNLIIDGGFPYRLIFSDITMLFFGLAALLFGFDAVMNKEYLKFLVSRWSSMKVYISIISARIILLLLSFLFLSTVLLFFLLMKGIELSTMDFTGLLGYFWSAILLLLFFFVTGTLLGPIRSKGIGLTVLFIVWIVSIIFIPIGINYLANSESAKLPSPFRLDSDKLQVVNSFEDYIEDKYGKFDNDNIEAERQIVEDYFNNHYTKMERIEEVFKGKLEEHILLFKQLSVLTPITFHNLTASEVSSRGYTNYFAFYGYLQELRRRFLRFWIDCVYYHNPKVMVNFVKGDENLFYAKSRLPDNFGTGVVVNLGYIIIMLAASFFLFKRALFRLDKKEIESLGDRDIEVKTNEVSVWKIKPGKGKAFNKMFFTLLSREIDRLASKGFKAVVKIGEVNIAAEKINKSLAYFPRAEAFPGELKVKDLAWYNAKSTGLTRQETIALLEKPEIKSLARKKFKHLDDNEEVDAVLVLTYFTKADIYLIVDLATGYDQESAIKLNDRMTQLNEDSVVIYLTTKELTVEEEFETYVPDVKWKYIVEVLKEKKKLKKE
jgi:ABC-type transport system involved in multi-copper enzyme maturation permease subunit/ABC-type cobalamin/Fe3+-siderophores transport system ATPase subunit